MKQTVAKLTWTLVLSVAVAACSAGAASAQRTSALAWHVNINDKCNNPSFCGSTKLGDHDEIAFYADGTLTAERGDRPTPGDPSPQLKKVTGTWHIAPGLTGMNDFIVDEATFTFLGGGGGPPTTEGPSTIDFDLGVPGVAGHYIFSESPPPWGVIGEIPPPGVTTQVEVIEY
jgi:hypothetical protein